MEEKKENIVSYTFPEKERNKVFKFIAIEITIILVFVTILFLVLNYLNIFPLPRIAPTLFGWLPVQEGVKKGIPLNPEEPKIVPSPTIDPRKAKGDIVLVSEVPRYSLTLSYKNELIDLLRSFSVFGKGYYNDKPENPSQEPLEKIVVHLIDKDTFDNLLLENADIPYSTFAEFKGTNLDLYIYISPQIFAKGPIEVGKNMQMGMMKALYKMSHPARSTEEINAQAEFLKTYLTRFSNNKYITVKADSP